MTLESGRTLDALVAEKVMGWKSTGMLELNIFDEEPWLDENQCERWRPPYYSTDIKAAWKVVQKLDYLDFEIVIYGPIDRGAIENENWQVEFTNKVTRAWYHSEDQDVSMAICIAALKAVGSEET